MPDVREMGSMAKCRQLFNENLEVLSVHAKAVSKSPSDSLDIASVMKSATAIQEDISLSKLLKSVMTVLIENAGADHGCLLLAEGQRLLYMQARRDLPSGECSVLQNIELNDLKNLPHSVISYVARVSESVVIDDAPEHVTFGPDPYIQERSPKSILCLPIVLRGDLLAVVYGTFRTVWCLVQSQKRELLS
jgi:GAF domain-containing protein